MKPKSYAAKTLGVESGQRWTAVNNCERIKRESCMMLIREKYGELFLFTDSAASVEIRSEKLCVTIAWACSD